MRREKRSIYLMPDLAQRVEETAAEAGISLSGLVETALDEHFARESVFGAVEALTRRVGEIDERIAAQQATLTKLDTAVAAIGRGLVIVRDLLKPTTSAVEQPQPQQEREPEPATARPSGLLGGWRR